MFDLHTHSILSDGVLLPVELARRYEAKGYKTIALTDHIDYSNVDSIISGVIKVSKKINESDMKIKMIPGVEITHVPIKQIKPLVQYVRDKGIKLVIVHGETIVEPVAENTNRIAAEVGVDILSHPGLIDDKTVEICCKNNVFLEITSRKGHSLTNGHVVRKVEKIGGKLILNTDSHVPEDILLPQQLKQVAIGAGLSSDKVEEILKVEEEFILTKIGKDFI